VEHLHIWPAVPVRAQPQDLGQRGHTLHRSVIHPLLTQSCGSGAPDPVGSLSPTLDVRSVLWIRNDFFRIRILLFSWFRILQEFFLGNINFTFVFPSCKCDRLHIMTRNILGNFCDKKEFILKSSIFVEKLSNFISFSE
jgi:hypothetical protein